MDWTPSCATRRWTRGRCLTARTWRREGLLRRWGLTVAPWSWTSRWQWLPRRGSHGWPTHTLKAGCTPYAWTPFLGGGFGVVFGTAFATAAVGAVGGTGGTLGGCAG